MFVVKLRKRTQSPTVTSAKSHTNPMPHDDVGEAGDPGRHSGGAFQQLTHPGWACSVHGATSESNPTSSGAGLEPQMPIGSVCVCACVLARACGTKKDDGDDGEPRRARGPARGGSRAALRHYAAESPPSAVLTGPGDKTTCLSSK